VPNEVAVCAVRSLVERANRGGLGSLLDDVGLSAEELTNRRRVDWEIYAQLVDRFVERAGGLDEAAHLADDLHLRGGVLDWVLSSRFAPRHIYAQACALAPRAWRNLEVTVVPDGAALRVQARLVDGIGSAAFFLISRSSLANLPTHAGLDRAEVVIEELSAMGATWRISTPPNPNAEPDGLSDPFGALAREAQVLRELGRQLVAAEDLAGLQKNLEQVWARLGETCPVRILAAPQSGALAVLLRGEPLGWLAVEAGAHATLGPLLPWIALGLDHIRTLALSSGAHLAALALHARAGAAFVVDELGHVVWANGPGWAWLASTRDGRERVAVAARKRLSSTEFVVRPMPKPAGHLVVTLSDPQGDARDRAAAASEAWRLTPTETLVLAEVLRGASNKDIGIELGIVESTVEAHMTHLFRKARIQGRTSLISRVWSTAW
jgi:DNA-binding CsgD family transcriptional regulator